MPNSPGRSTRLALVLKPSRAPSSGDPDHQLYRIRVVNSRIRGELRVPIRWIAHSVRMRRTAPDHLTPHDHGFMWILGGRLMDALPKQVQQLLREATGRVDIALDGAPELYALPWELLADAGMPVLEGRIEVARCRRQIEEDSRPTLPSVTLIAASVRTAAGTLDRRHVLLDIHEGIRDAKLPVEVAAGTDVIKGHGVDRTLPVDRVLQTPEDVHEALARSNSILHLIGNSNAEPATDSTSSEEPGTTIRFDLAGGGTYDLGIDRLAALVPATTKLVVVHACQPFAEIAKALHVEHVVGAYCFAQPSLCAAWSPPFYRALHRCRSISEAARRARNQLLRTESEQRARYAWAFCHWPATDQDRPFVPINEQAHWENLERYQGWFRSRWNRDAGEDIPEDTISVAISEPPDEALASVLVGASRQRRSVLLWRALLQCESEDSVPVFCDLRSLRKKRRLRDPARFAERESSIPGLSESLRWLAANRGIRLDFSIDDGVAAGSNLQKELAVAIHDPIVGQIVVGRSRATDRGLPSDFVAFEELPEQPTRARRAVRTLASWSRRVATALLVLIVALFGDTRNTPAKTTVDMSGVRLGLSLPESDDNDFGFADALDMLRQIHGLELVLLDEPIDSRRGGRARARRVARSQGLDGVLWLNVTRIPSAAQVLVHFNLTLADESRYALATDEVAIHRPVSLPELADFNVQPKFARRIEHVALCLMAAYSFERNQVLTARKLWQRARDLQHPGPGFAPSHAERAKLEFNLGRCAIALEQGPVALEHARLAEVFATRIARFHPRRKLISGRIEGLTGIALQHERRFTAAADSYESALSTLAGVAAGQEPAIARLLTNSAIVSKHLGKLDAAAESARRAATIAAGLLEHNPSAASRSLVVRARLVLAGALRSTEGTSAALGEANAAWNLAQQFALPVRASLWTARIEATRIDILRRAGLRSESLDACVRSMAAWSLVPDALAQDERALGMATTLHQRHLLMQSRHSVADLDRALDFAEDATPCAKRNLTMASLLVNRARAKGIATTAAAIEDLREASTLLAKVKGERTVEQLTLEGTCLHGLARENFARALRVRRALPSWQSYAKSGAKLASAFAQSEDWGTTLVDAACTLHRDVAIAQSLGDVEKARARLAAQSDRRSTHPDPVAEKERALTAWTRALFAATLGIPRARDLAAAARTALERAAGAGARVAAELGRVHALDRAIDRRTAREADRPVRRPTSVRQWAHAATWLAAGLLWQRLAHG